jgi:hypothetical protein
MTIIKKIELVVNKTGEAKELLEKIQNGLLSEEEINQEYLELNWPRIFSLCGWTDEEISLFADVITEGDLLSNWQLSGSLLRKFFKEGKIEEYELKNEGYSTALPMDLIKKADKYNSVSWHSLANRAQWSEEELLRYKNIIPLGVAVQFSDVTEEFLEQVSTTKDFGSIIASAKSPLSETFLLKYASKMNVYELMRRKDLTPSVLIQEKGRLDIDKVFEKVKKHRLDLVEAIKDMLTKKQWAELFFIHGESLFNHFEKEFASQFPMENGKVVYSDEFLENYINGIGADNFFIEENGNLKGYGELSFEKIRQFGFVFDETVFLELLNGYSYDFTDEQKVLLMEDRLVILRQDTNGNIESIRELKSKLSKVKNGKSIDNVFRSDFSHHSSTVDFYYHGGCGCSGCSGDHYEKEQQTEKGMWKHIDWEKGEETSRYNRYYGERDEDENDDWDY